MTPPTTTPPISDREDHLIVVGPCLYYVAEGHFTRDRKRATVYSSHDEAMAVANTDSCWKAFPADLKG